MNAAPGNSPQDRSPASAGQPPPFPEPIQPVLPGFEGLEASNTLPQSPRQARARRQRRPRPASIKPRPDQLSWPHLP